MARIGDINRIFIVEHGIEINDPDVRGVVDLYHISHEIRSVYSAAVPVERDILFPADLDHAIQLGIGENIVAGYEFDVGIAVDDHVVGDGNAGLGNQEQRQKRQDGKDCFHVFLNLKQTKLRRKVTKSQSYKVTK